MPTSSCFTLTVCAVAMLLPGLVQAQQKAAATTPAAPAVQSQPAPQTSAPALSSSKDKFSYALGLNLGTNFHTNSVEVDPELVLRGLKDGLAGGKALMTEDEARAALMAVQQEMRQKQQEMLAQLRDANKKEGETFLGANKSKDGVVALPSGLQYKILTTGTGPKPAATDRVVCNYRGTLINGKEFDSSYKRGEPATFAVNGVIRGWTEALQLMPVGSKWQLFIPSDLAYGERGANPDIGPDATLIFEVELVSIEKKEAEKPAAPEKK